MAEKSYRSISARLRSMATGAVGGGSLGGAIKGQKGALVGAGLGAVAGLTDSVLRDREERKMSKKGGLYGDRDDGTLLTENGRLRENENFQGLVESLFSKKARTAALSDAQLGPLFPKTGKESYGHSLRAGLNAREASRRTTAIFRDS